MFGLSGGGINVTLSNEQMEYIASLTADKVNETKTYALRQEDYYKEEIKLLEKKIASMEKLLVEKDLRMDFIKDRFSKLNSRYKKTKENLDRYENL